MDQLGLSDEIRKLYKEYAYTREISYNIVSGHSLKLYVFGSSIEGTKTPGMNSDFDVAFVNHTIEVQCIYKMFQQRWETWLFNCSSG